MSSEPQGLRIVNQDGAPLRIPKLTYRNPVPDSQDAAHLPDCRPNDRPTIVTESHETNPRSPTFSTFSADEITPCPANSAGDRSTYNGLRRSSASAAVSVDEALVNNNNIDIKRKKHSSLFGFLSLKEPSTSALDDFARQQQKQAAAKGGRPTAVGLPGTSSQKLPPSVPKVNSRWDGLPSPLKDKMRDPRGGKRDSSFTVTSRMSTYSSSSGDSKSSSQASFGSSSSTRLASPLVGSIAEVPEPSKRDTLSTRHNPSAGRAQCDAAPRSPNTTSFNHRKQRSDSVAGLDERPCPKSLLHSNEAVSTSVINTTHNNKSDVLPWEAQSPSLMPSAMPPRIEEEKKKKLGFLSRKHR